MERLSYYIDNPGALNRETLYELRKVVKQHPCYDAARLMMLRNLYLLHDIEFGKELRKSALYLKSRLPLFELMEGYGLPVSAGDMKGEPSVDRTMTLIDAFLGTLPEQGGVSLAAEGAAAVDYASAYLSQEQPQDELPKMRGQDLIDEFLSGDNEKITLQLQPAGEAEDGVLSPQNSEEILSDSTLFTETLANIYIRQRKYDKALEIIRRIDLEFPNKNRYFAHQIRFLEKLVKHTKQK